MSLADRERNIARFMSKVNRDGPIVRAGLSPCWDWKPCQSNGKYGRFWLDGRTINAHTASCDLLRSASRRALCVLHKCDRPQCVNPSHLFLGTHADNVADKVAKGRQAKGVAITGRRREARGDRNGARTKPWTRPRGEKNGSAKLSEAEARAAKRAMLLGESVKSVAGMFGISTCAAYKIKNGLLWRHVV